MSDNTSVIDAVRLLAKATEDDSAKLSDIVKGSLHPDQIDDMRLMLSRARDGSVTQGTATAPAPAASAAACRAIRRSVQQRACKETPTKLPLSIKGCSRAPRRIISLR